MKLALTAALGVMAAAMVAGCGNLSPPQFLSSGSLRLTVMAPPVAHPDTRKSWLAPEVAKTSRLLFESDPGIYDVDIFTLPDLKLKGQLTGFKFPTGECSDNHGNVWIGNYLKHQMLEYSHAGKLLKTIVRARLRPYGCAVNPVNGALAVTDFNLTRSKVGEVMVFSSPSVAPIVLRNPEQFEYIDAAYDPSGNLWVTGFSDSEYPMLSKCGTSSCRTISLSGGSIFEPGAIVWDNVNHQLVIFDQYCHESGTTCSYPVSTQGVLGTPTMYLSATGGALCNMFQAVAATGKGTIVVGSDNEYSCTGYKSSTVDVWAYPSGGKPTRTGSSVYYPWGAAVSTK